jgi:hypothetical protein
MLLPQKYNCNPKQDWYTAKIFFSLIYNMHGKQAQDLEGAMDCSGIPDQNPSHQIAPHEVETAAEVTKVGAF